MSRARWIGGAVAVVAAVAIVGVAWAGEPRADGGTAVDLAPLTVVSPAPASTAPSPGDEADAPSPAPSGRPTPVSPPAAPPVPLGGDKGPDAPPSTP